MDKYAIWKWLILIGMLAGSMVWVYPPVDVKDKAGNVVQEGKIKLGLDLRGGTSYTLEIDSTDMTPGSLHDAQARALEVIRNRVDQMGMAEPVIYPEPGGRRIVVQLPGLKSEDRERAMKNIERAAFLEFRMVHPKNDELVRDLFDKGLEPEGYKIVSAEEGVPGGAPRLREYYKRDRSRDPEGVSEEEIRERLRAFRAPPGHELLLYRERKHGQNLYIPYYVNRRRELSGEHLKTAGIQYNQFSQPYVTLAFDRAGARRFEALTTEYAPGGPKNPSLEGRRFMAIVLDGTLYSAPWIKTPIQGGNAIIEGSFTLKEAQDLAIVLRTGSLPAPVRLIEERTVDPTLGRDSIESGGRATVVGGLLVMLFMGSYYLLAGLVANVALILNILLLPLGLIMVSGFFSSLDSSALGASMGSLPTLTLPGLAGIALTIGMSVDANVQIYERMREEQRAGKSFKAVIEAGYDKAFSAIFDSNLTTVIAAVIMFWMGSGPIRGFAVMLTAGIMISLFTALVCTRMVFDLLARYTRIRQVRMFEMLRDANFDFVGRRAWFVLLSLVIIAVSWGVFAVRGKANYGIDFSGGASITFQFREKQPVDRLRAALNEAGVKEATIQYQHEPGAEAAGRDVLVVKVSFEDGKKAAAAVVAAFESSGYSVVQEDSVGAQVGSELQRKALWALGLSLAAMILYVSLRFEFPYAVGAVVALFHDVLVAVGLYCLLGKQLNLNLVAAVLAIIGYSINDTIVIFDRIRENRKLMHGKSYRQIANASINQTLSRTLLTSLTTLLAVGALLVLGGGAIYDFSLCMFIGLIAGTYSSICIATPVVLLWHPEKKPAAAKAAA